MLKKYYRPLFVTTLTAGGLAILLELFLNFYYNPLASTNIFVSFSVAVLMAVLLVLVLRYMLLMWFAYLQHMERIEEPLETSDYPFVSVIVPAYNEEKVIQSAIEDLKLRAVVSSGQNRRKHGIEFCEIPCAGRGERNAAGDDLHARVKREQHAQRSLRLRRHFEELIAPGRELKRRGHGELQPAVHAGLRVDLVTDLHVNRGGLIREHRGG